MEDKKIVFDYYHGKEAEQYSFFRIPKILMRETYFKKMPIEAKVLYGLMLDRMALSVKNQWCDEDDHVYIIYTLDEIREDLGCGKDKGVKLLAILTEYGLIERRKRGFGMPDLVYVKNFASSDFSTLKTANTAPEGKEEPEEIPAGKPVSGSLKAELSSEDSERSENQNSRGRECRSREVGNAELKTSENQKSRRRKIRSLKNKTDKNKTDINNIYNPSIYPSDLAALETTSPEAGDPAPESGEVMDYSQRLSYAQLISAVKKKIGYDALLSDYGDAVQIFPELIAEILIQCRQQRPVKIGKNEYDRDLVKARFLRVGYADIQYILHMMDERPAMPKNIKQYYLAALFNAPATKESYYERRVKTDMGY